MGEAQKKRTERSLGKGGVSRVNCQLISGLDLPVTAPDPSSFPSPGVSLCPSAQHRGHLASILLQASCSSQPQVTEENLELSVGALISFLTHVRPIKLSTLDIRLLKQHRLRGLHGPNRKDREEFLQTPSMALSAVGRSWHGGSLGGKQEVRGVKRGCS